MSRRDSARQDVARDQRSPPRSVRGLDDAPQVDVVLVEQATAPAAT